ncbi:MAG: hypothetical protein WAL63_11575 [Solirubrobacteraceae bacterium]
MSRTIRNGDVVLVDGLEQGLISWSIGLGTRLRHGPRTPLARWTHVALIYDAPPGGPDASGDEDAIKIVEATGASGVHLAFLSKYPPQRRRIIHTDVDEQDWGEMRAFLDSVLSERATYGWATYAGLTLYAVTGTKLCVQEAGTATCSGLVCDALTRRGIVWKRPPFACTPADIAEELPPQIPRLTSRDGPRHLSGQEPAGSSRATIRPRRSS